VNAGTDRVLVLGGTAEARRLAAALDGAGVAVLTSLAGRVGDPRLPPGDVRIGGFGGPSGLNAWLRESPVAAVVDATHPFAAAITASAAQACSAVGVPLLRLQRPGWQPGPGDDWRWVGSLEEAAATLGGFGSVFLTTGRQGLGAFARVSARCLVRAIEPPDPPLPARTVVVLARGPFTVDEELALMREHGVQVVVSKDSGGGMTAAKLEAARRLGLSVVLVRRPPLPAGVPVVDTPTGALDWLRGTLSAARAPAG
jgi:precorrin-6A/cobalt-precorrin-6A reductase